MHDVCFHVLPSKHCTYFTPIHLNLNAVSFIFSSSVFPQWVWKGLPVSLSSELASHFISPVTDSWCRQELESQASWWVHVLKQKDINFSYWWIFESWELTGLRNLHVLEGSEWVPARSWIPRGLFSVENFPVFFQHGKWLFYRNEPKVA